MKKHYQKNRKSRNQKPQQNPKGLASRRRKPLPEELLRPKLLTEVQIVRDDVITIPRAEYDDLVNNAHVVNVVEELCKCSGHYTAAKFLQHMVKNYSTDWKDGAPGMNTLVTLDRAEYDDLNQITGLLNAIVNVSRRPDEYDLYNMLEILYCKDGKVGKG